MRDTIYIRLRRIEGALTRTLGLIERRGFAVGAIKASPAELNGDLRMQIRVESKGRCVQKLTEQIERLLDVRHASRRADGERCIHEASENPPSSMEL